MSINSDTLRKLGALKLDPEQMAGVLDILADMSAVDEARRQGQRERTKRHRDAKRDCNVTVTDQSRDPALSPKRKVSPCTPSKENTPIPTQTLGSSEPSGRPVDDLFAEFWAVCPKREGPNPKKPARLAFERSLKRGNSFEGIMAATKDLAAKHPKPTRFCPQAVTWLNQDRCADFAEAKPMAKSKPAWWTNPQADQDWEKILLGARLSSAWHVDTWGPPPFEAGCRVPSHLIRYDDERSWSVRKAA